MRALNTAWCDCGLHASTAPQRTSWWAHRNSSLESPVRHSDAKCTGITRVLWGDAWRTRAAVAAAANGWCCAYSSSALAVSTSALSPSPHASRRATRAAALPWDVELCLHSRAA